MEGRMVKWNKKYLVLINRKKADCWVKYDLPTIEDIKIGPAILFHSWEDCYGNMIDPNELMLMIYFKDGSMSSLVEENWAIRITNKLPGEITII